jgi:hypothetical protein
VESQIIPVPDEKTLLGHSGMLLQMKFTEFEESKYRNLGASNSISDHTFLQLMLQIVTQLREGETEMNIAFPK